MSKFMISAILVIAFVAFVQAKVYYEPGLSEPAAYGYNINDRERRDLRDGRVFGGGPPRMGGAGRFTGNRPSGGRPFTGGGGGRPFTGGGGGRPFTGGRGGRPYRSGGI